MVVKSQFRLTDDAEVFAAEVRRSRRQFRTPIEKSHENRYLLRFDVSTLWPHVTARSHIHTKDLILTTGVRAPMHWIQTHVGHTYNERVDALAKAATTRQVEDVEVIVTCASLRNIYLAEPCPFGKRNGAI